MRIWARREKNWLLFSPALFGAERGRGWREKETMERGNQRWGKKGGGHGGRQMERWTEEGRKEGWMEAEGWC